VLYELLYMSLANWEMSQEDLEGILAEARPFNADRGITGMLVYHRREFMQVIEGEKREILSLYERIERDSRHSRLRILIQGPIEARGFANWTMQFVNAKDVDPDLLPGYRDIWTEGFSASDLTEEPTKAKRLLELSRDLLLTGRIAS